MDTSSARLADVVRVFLRLGLIAFGGPAAHIALFEQECVRRLQWIDRRRFLDLLAVANLVPGPTSTELAIHIGRMRAGWAGLVAGGVAFITPWAICAAMFAWAYVRWGEVPAAVGLVEALRPAVLVVVADAVRVLGRTALRSPTTFLWAALAAGAALLGASEVGVVLVALFVGLAAPSPSRVRAVPLLELFVVCFTIGATLLGSGYVLIAYLDAELGGRGWLDHAQLLDAVAIGQITPGPVTTAVTFVGYLLAGWPGAVVATVAVFLPSFLFVAATGPLLDRLRERPRLRRALDVVNATVIGLIAAVLVTLAPTALRGAFQIVVAIVAAIAIWVAGVRSTTVMIAAAAAGVVRQLL
jgi:chromate transporter